VARALAAAGCRHFFVAHLSEGLALRAAIGPGPQVAVLNGFPPGADGGAGLVPVLNGLPDVAAWGEAGGEAILHLDTGMARLGLDAREQAALAQDRAPLGRARLLYVMTHLACADEPHHPLNAAQRARFAEAASRIAPGVPTSLANSSGLFLGEGFRSDLARPGCALYGINPTPGRPNPMRQAVTLEGEVLQVRRIEEGRASATAPPGPRGGRAGSRPLPSGMPMATFAPSRAGPWAPFMEQRCRWWGACPWTSRPSTSPTCRMRARATACGSSAGQHAGRHRRALRHHRLRGADEPRRALRADLRGRLSGWTGSSTRWPPSAARRAGGCRVSGAVALFALEAIGHLLRPPFYGRLFLRAFVEIAWFSLPVVR
jgi:hypothetical protein